MKREKFLRIQYFQYTMSQTTPEKNNTLQTNSINLINPRRVSTEPTIFSPKRAIYFNKFKEYITQLKNSDIIAIVHHTDPDGISSAVIISKLISKLRENPPNIIIACSYAMLKEGKFVNKIFESNATHTIIVDLNIDENYELCLQLANSSKLLIIDHHAIKNEDKLPKEIILIKPQYFTNKDPSKYCTAKLTYDLTYDLALPFIDATNMDWIACVGIIGDMAYSLWEDFVQKTFIKYNFEMKKEIFETQIGMIARMISSAESTRQPELAYKIMMTAEKPEEMLNSSLAKLEQEINKEMNFWLAKLEELLIKTKNALFFEINSIHNIKSPITTIFSTKHADTTVIIASAEAERYQASARRSDGKYQMNKLCEKAVEGIPQATGGGHIQASGASVPIQYKEQLKKKLLSLLPDYS